ncbi:MAG: HDIG domain-containing protein [Synergistaceae bacterium]|nr:HDIG domain-containing protein [Synergistaceae bacterium]
MKRKLKPRVLIPSERNFFQRIDFERLFSYTGPVLFLLIAGVLIVMAQWAVLNKRGDSFKVGFPAPETYRVITHMRYDDQESATNLRNMVRESVVDVTVRDVAAKSRLQRRLEAVREAKDVPSAKNSPYLSYLPELLLNSIIRMSEGDKARIINIAYQAGSTYIDRIESEKVYRGNTVLMTSILWEEINRTGASVHDANFVYQILAGLGNLNFRTDEDLTLLARQAAANDVPAIDRRLEPGDVIVSAGEIVTAQTAVLLRLQGYTEDVFPFIELVAAVISVLALPFWLYIFNKGAGEHKPTWWCVVFIVMSAWIFETIAARLGIYGAGILGAVVVSFLCVEDYLAFCIAFMAASSGVFIITGQAVSHVILLSTLSVFASTVGFCLLRHLESRRQVSTRITISALILTVTRMILRCLQGASFTRDSFRLFIPLGEFWQEALLFFAFEVVTGIFMMGALQYFEEYLGALSIMSIREISNPSSPLLRDLQRQAPGTYQHSMTIATLIEAVGMELGMDTNLLRAGAYYHDIGKIRKPECFVENQGGGENVHDTLEPEESSRIIISHVRDGLELALEAKLPKRIRDFIAEHHGDTSTRYFYNKAISLGHNAEWSKFCYPGPKPRSRETALLMITDSVEAAVRAANVRAISTGDQHKAVKSIEKIVAQVIQSKINENQFDNVALTMKDLNIIRKTLTAVLVSMYHTRAVKKIERRK